MLILDSTTDSLRIRLASAHTTTPLRCVTSWRDTTTTAFTPGSTLSSSDGTTGVEIAPAPAASTQRIIDFISVLNTDTVNHTVTIYIYDGTTNFDMVKVTLAPFERLEYGEGYGFQVYNSAGSMKTLVQATQNVISTGWNTVVLGADVINNNAVANTLADVTGLSFAVVAGVRYWFEFMIMFQANATSTGSRWTINGPTSPTFLNYRSEYSLTSTTKTNNEQLSAYDVPAATNATSGFQPGANIALITGYIQPSADGTVTARFASEVASAAITAKQGSICRYIAAV